MQRIYFYLSVAVLAFLIDGCATAPPTNAQRYAIEFAEPDRVSFEGRGAGAGMMLSGSMGAMGVALGVAIDVGIGKEIGETAAASGVDFYVLLADAVAKNEFESSIEWVESIEEVEKIYRVKNYGFVTVRGSGDEVFPSFEIDVFDGDTLVQTMSMPDDFLESAESIPRTNFQTIKTDATEIQRLWSRGLMLAFGE